MKVLLADGYNLLHRARFGFGKGDYNIVYNFFRGFRSLTEKMDPDKIVFVLEGFPQFRYGIFPEYKANRKTTDPKKLKALEDFRRQKTICIDLLARFPIDLIKHSDYEGDDLIGTLVKKKYVSDKCIVATGDTDFIQLLKLPHAHIYNPIKKLWVAGPDYDYVLWKSMVGDTSDNINGIKGVGPKTAKKVLALPEGKRQAWLDEKPERRSIVERNQRLIRFADVPLNEVEDLSEETDFEYAKDMFAKMDFKTMLSDKSWNKYVETFEGLKKS
jgi:5'-3' exonuclease